MFNRQCKFMNVIIEMRIQGTNYALIVVIKNFSPDVFYFIIIRT